MEPFRTCQGRIAVVPGDHLDTDRIIPARFLSRISRFGYGELLFKDVRGPEFALDQPEAKDASVLVVGTNFGCGSSREHAVWAIQQAGFRCVIARVSEETRGFSDIFRSNSANCGLLLIDLEADDHALLTGAGSGTEVEIDLPAQTITVGTQKIGFEIDPAAKEAMLEGRDLIGTTLRYAEQIRGYEEQSQAFVPSRGL